MLRRQTKRLWSGLERDGNGVPAGSLEMYGHELLMSTEGSANHDQLIAKK